MAKGKVVAVNKEVLKWARKTAGYDDTATAASQLDIDEATLKQLEDGHESLNLTMFHKMVTVYKRSPTVLLIPAPPKTEEPPKTFRTVGGKTPKMSPQIHFAMRQAKYVQDEISQLLENDPNLMSPYKFDKLTIKDDSDSIALKIRKQVNIPLEEQLAIHRSDSFKVWRTRLQELGILILGYKMPVDDCYGFALTGNIPTIVFNKSYGIEANTFTLFHELGHIMLGEDAICLGIHRDNHVEKWCNDFAGKVLVQEDGLRLINRNFRVGEIRDWTFKEVQNMARKLKVSKDVIALRLEYLKSAKPDLYELIVKNRIKMSISTPGGLALPHQKAINTLGTTTVAVVLNALKKREIDNTKATEILDIKSKWISSAEIELYKQFEKYLPINK